MKQHRTLFAAGAVAAALSIMPAHATPGSGFVGTPVSQGAYGDMAAGVETDDYELELRSKGNADVYVTRNAIAINGQSGWHRHPGPSLITVTVGEITAYESTNPLCTPRIYRVGEGFVDNGDHAHLLRNESGSPAETVAVQFLPEGATRRIDAPKPTNCPAF